MKWLIAPRADMPQHEQALQMLRQLAGCDLEVVKNALGAPLWRGHLERSLSISHCRSAVAVAISEGASVGIDVECRRHIDANLLPRVCTAEEEAWVNACADREMAFLQLWTRKEAVLKCRGTGIRGFGSLQSALQASDIEVQNLHCELPDVVAALAVKVG